MSNASGIKVKGYKAGIKALQAIGVPNDEIKSAGKQAGEVVAREARTLVPVRTGKLRNSIKVNNALRMLRFKQVTTDLFLMQTLFTGVGSSATSSRSRSSSRLLA